MWQPRPTLVRLPACPFDLFLTTGPFEGLHDIRYRVSYFSKLSLRERQSHLNRSSCFIYGRKLISALNFDIS
jgi:hypothetical protein